MNADRTSHTGLHAPLDKPPTAFALTVRKILTRVQAGEIRVPSFQRPLRWDASDVVKLFDSILRGYPVGSLLFWKHPVPADPALRIGNATIDAPAVADGWYIVDGQQRITALAAALLDLDHGGEIRWMVRFDPTSSTFLSGPADPADLGRHVPLSALGDIRRLGKWFRTCDLSEQEQDRVEDLQQRLLDYELPAYSMETEDVEALRGVFARLNSTGVRMRADEVFQALLGGGGGAQGKPGSVDLVALQQACDLDSFGQPPRPEALKALLAMSGLDPTKRLEDLGEDAASRLVDSSDAIEAIRRAVAFLQAPVDATEPGAGIPAYAFIPYPVVFVMLARWFHLFPEPDLATRTELSRWLWRGVVTGVHERSAVSAMRLQVRAIKEPMDESLRRLLAAVDSLPRREWPLDAFHASHAASRVELLALLARGPRDRMGDPVSWRTLVSSGDRVAREIVPSPAWRGLDPDSQRLAHTAANRVLLDARHTGLRGELKKWVWETDRDALESHLIDERGLYLLQNDIPAFLRHRAARIRTEVAAFLSRRVGDGQPRLFAVDSYYEKDEPTAMATSTSPRGQD